MVQKGFPEEDGLRIPRRKLAERCLGGTFSSASTANLWLFIPFYCLSKFRFGISQDFWDSFRETVWKIRIGFTSGSQESVKRGEKRPCCHFAPPKHAI